MNEKVEKFEKLLGDLTNSSVDSQEVIQMLANSGGSPEEISEVTEIDKQLKTIVGRLAVRVASLKRNSE